MLIDHGASIEEKDDFGDQPIHSAAKSGCLESLKLLHDQGAYMCGKGISVHFFIQYVM